MPDNTKIFIYSSSDELDAAIISNNLSQPSTNPATASNPISLPNTSHRRNFNLPATCSLPSNSLTTAKPERALKSSKPEGLLESRAERQYITLAWAAGRVVQTANNLEKMLCFCRRATWVSGLFCAQVPMIQSANLTTSMDSSAEIHLKISGHKFIFSMFEALSIPSTIISNSSKAKSRSSSPSSPPLFLITAIQSTGACVKAGQYHIPLTFHPSGIILAQNHVNNFRVLAKGA